MCKLSSSNAVMTSHDWALVWRSLEAMVVQLITSLCHTALCRELPYYNTAAANSSALQHYFKHLVPSAFQLPCCCLWTPLMSHKDRKL